MAAKRLTASQVRQDFGETVSRVAYSDEPVVIERRGRPLVALISFRAYEAFERFVEAAEDHIDAEAAMKTAGEETLDFDGFMEGKS